MMPEKRSWGGGGGSDKVWHKPGCANTEKF